MAYPLSIMAAMQSLKAGYTSESEIKPDVRGGIDLRCMPAAKRKRPSAPDNDP